MRIRAYNLMVLVLILVVFAQTARAESEQSQEYKVKAAFLYNFINFVDWPKDRVADSNWCRRQMTGQTFWLTLTYRF